MTIRAIATTGFVQNVRDALQTTIEGGAANSRDTLQELYTVLNAAIALKANIASPTFTGNPTLTPTPSDQGTIRHAHRDDRVATVLFSCATPAARAFTIGRRALATIGNGRRRDTGCWTISTLAAVNGG